VRRCLRVPERLNAEADAHDSAREAAREARESPSGVGGGSRPDLEHRRTSLTNVPVMADDDYPDFLPGESLVEWLRRVMPEAEDKSAYENPVTSLRFGLGGLVDKAKAAAQR